MSEPQSILKPTQCRAVGCEKPAFGLRYCRTHADAFEGVEANALCRVEGCGDSLVVGHGLCRPHYMRWRRWSAKVAAGSPGEVEAWLSRDWSRPVGERATPALKRITLRFEKDLHDRVAVACLGDSEATVYELCRRALEQYARALPEPTPAQLKQLAKVRAAERRRRRH